MKNFRAVRAVGLALALAALGGVTGCTTPSPSGADPVAEADQSLANMVMARLTEDPFLERASIQVTNDEGVVTLRGMLRNEAQRMRALSIARATAGVRGVIDNLRIY